jgi:hypothetical protein
VYGTALLVSEATYLAARDRVIGQPVDIVQVQRRSRGVGVYELLDLGSEDERMREIATLAEAAIAAYVRRDFRHAAALCEAMLRQRPDDTDSPA